MSTTEWIEDAVGNIDDRFILEALEYRPGKRTKKIVTACVAAAAAVCVIVGLAAWGGSNPGNNQQIAVEPDVDTEAGSETADSTETVFAEAEEGTSFPEISVTQIRQVVNGQGMLAYSLLYFNDLMYTSAATDTHTYTWEEGQQDEDVLESVLGDEIGTVYINHSSFMSTDETELAAVTDEGTLYKVNGYDESFRVAVYFEPARAYLDGEIVPTLMIFDHLNGITLASGSDLFEDRLHLGEAVSVTGSTTVRDSEGNQNVVAQADLTGSDEISEFLDAIDAAEVIDPADDVYNESYYSTEDGTNKLTFTSVNGIEDILYIYDDGHVLLRSNSKEKFMVQIDAGICEEIIELLG